MKRYKVIPNDDGTQDVIQQPGTIRKVWRWYWSVLIYLIAFSLIWHNTAFVIIGTIVCLVIEHNVRKAARS